MRQKIESLSMYANLFGMFGCPLRRVPDDADLVILGVPYDLATSGRAGARSGPAAMRAASANLRWEEKRWPWQFNAFEQLKVVDMGDLEPATGASAAFASELQAAAHGVLAAGKTLLSLGGDHYVTLPLVRAAASVHGPLALIHFDSHTDTYPEEAGEYNHGSMFYHALQEGLVDPVRSVQVAIRTEYDAGSHPFTVIDAPAAIDRSSEDICAQISTLVGDRPVYLTFDIDALDPAYAPGTGTPVPGGLSTDKALRIIRGLSDLNIVAMDVVEVAPAYDHAEITALAAAALALDMIYCIATREHNKHA